MFFLNLADPYPDTDPNPDKETCKSGPRGLKMAKPSGSNVRSIFFAERLNVMNYLCNLLIFLL